MNTSSFTEVIDTVNLVMDKKINKKLHSVMGLSKSDFVYSTNIDITFKFIVGTVEGSVQ